MDKSKIQYTIDAEMMYCPKCCTSPYHATVHGITGQYWTCLICGHQLGKELSWYQKLIKKIFE